MTHRDRAGDASGQGAGRRQTVGDAGHPPSAAAAPLLRRTGRQGFPTPTPIRPHAGSPARPERRFPQVLWAGAFGRPIALRRGAWLPMSRIAAPCAPGRKPWEAVSMGHYQRSLVLDGETAGTTSSARASGFHLATVAIHARVKYVTSIGSSPRSLSFKNSRNFLNFATPS